MHSVKAKRAQQYTDTSRPRYYTTTTTDWWNPETTQMTTGGKLIIQHQNRIGLIIGIWKLRDILILQQQMIIGGKILQHESQGLMCGILILRGILILLQQQIA